MSAADRIRREGPSVHHVLCSLRRPPTAWTECTCRVPQVATALADLLDVLDRISLLTVVDKYDEEISIDLLDARNALEAAVDRSGT